MSELPFGSPGTRISLHTFREWWCWTISSTHPELTYQSHACWRGIRTRWIKKVLFSVETVNDLVSAHLASQMHLWGRYREQNGVDASGSTPQDRWWFRSQGEQGWQYWGPASVRPPPENLSTAGAKRKEQIKHGAKGGAWKKKIYLHHYHHHPTQKMCVEHTRRHLKEERD